MDLSRLRDRDYRNHLRDLGQDHFEDTIPHNMKYILTRIHNVFESWEGFIEELDFKSFNLPVQVEDYSCLDWERIESWLEQLEISNHSQETVDYD